MLFSVFMKNFFYHVFALVMISITTFPTSILASSDAERDDNTEKSNSIFVFSDKISPTLNQWQSSSDPVVFAQENNLTYSADSILVYIYLDSNDSILKIPQNIEITSSADNIVVAFLDSRQITQAAQLDFVARIDLPVMAKYSH